MSTVTKDVPTTESPHVAQTPRRFALGAMGMSLVGALAELYAAAQPAAASVSSPCCGLGSSTACKMDCSGSCTRCSNFECPSGSHLEAWYCTFGTHTVGCGECTPGSDCVTGPFKCSNWWYYHEC